MYTLAQLKQRFNRIQDLDEDTHLYVGACGQPPQLATEVAPNHFQLRPVTVCDWPSERGGRSLGSWTVPGAEFALIERDGEIIRHTNRWWTMAGEQYTWTGSGWCLPHQLPGLAT